MLQASRSASSSCCCCCASPRLQVIYVTGRADPRERHRVLPRAAARRHPEPRAGPAAPGRHARRLAALAGREAARARPRILLADPRPHPRPRTLPPRPVHDYALERDLALPLGIPLYGADPRLLPLGTKTGCRRLFAEDGRPAPARVRGRSRPRRRRRRAGSRCERRGPARQTRSSSSTTASPGRATRSSSCAGCRRRDRPSERAVPSTIARGPWRFEHPETLWSATSAASRGRRHRRGARRAASSSAAPACSCASRRWARSSCSRRTTSCWAGRAARATSAAASRPTSATPRAITAGGGQDRATGSRAEGVLGRFAVDFVVVRDARGAWTPYAIELNLRKGGTTHPFLTLQFLTDGTYDPVTAAVHGAERTREAPRGHRPPRVRAAARAARSTTSSTSSCATGCTSTRRARPGSSST